MNMLVNFVGKAIAAATTFQQPINMQVRTELVKVNSGQYEQRPVLNSRRLNPRGKGGKKPHFKTGISAQRRAARKARNKAK